MSPDAEVFYYDGATGWSATFGGLPTTGIGGQLTITDAGLKSNGFGFTIGGTNNQGFIVETATNLASPRWQSIETNYVTGTSFNFTDPAWKNYRQRFYRVGTTP